MHKQVLHADLNNSEIRYKKVMYFPDMLCTLYIYATAD